jgi:hypothetical protein
MVLTCLRSCRLKLVYGACPLGSVPPSVVITIDVDLLIDLLAGNVEKVLRDSQEGMKRVKVDIGDDDGEDLGREWSYERSL